VFSVELEFGCTFKIAVIQWIEWFSKRACPLNNFDA